jgi:ATP-dependent DNA ligase
VKHDGYRTIVAVEGDATRAFTRNGHDWKHLSIDVALRK